MAINTKKNHRVQVTLPIAHYEAILVKIEKRKRAGIGRQLSASKYIADVVAEHLEQEQRIEQLFNRNDI